MGSGRPKKEQNYIYILPDAELSFTETQLETFIKYWNNGLSYKEIADKMLIYQYNVALLVIHCDLYGLIEPREGGIVGNENSSSI